MGWFGLAHNDAALRALGSLLGVLMVWGLLRLATALSGRQVGLLAGALAAVAPVLVWYSQELRMFQPAATAIVWAAYSLFRAGRSPSWPRRWLWWLGMVATLTAALYSYLFSAFVLPAIALLLLAPLLIPSSRPSPVTRTHTRHPSPRSSPKASSPSPSQPCSTCRWRAMPGLPTLARVRRARPSPPSAPTWCASCRSSRSGV